MARYAFIQGVETPKMETALKKEDEKKKSRAHIYVPIAIGVIGLGLAMDYFGKK